MAALGSVWIGNGFVDLSIRGQIESRIADLILQAES